MFLNLAAPSAKLVGPSLNLGVRSNVKPLVLSFDGPSSDGGGAVPSPEDAFRGGQSVQRQMRGFASKSEVEHPEKFFLTIDFDWQHDQLERMCFVR